MFKQVVILATALLAGCASPPNLLRADLNNADLACRANPWPTLTALVDCETAAERQAAARHGLNPMPLLEEFIAGRRALAAAYDAGDLSLVDYRAQYAALAASIHAEVAQ